MKKGLNTMGTPAGSQDEWIALLKKVVKEQLVL